MNIRKAIVGLFAAALLILPAAIPATAATESYVIAYENTGLDINFDTHWFYGNGTGVVGYPDLRNITADLHSGCNTSGPISVGWNDCISSIRVNLAPARCVKLWTGVSYSNSGLQFANTTAALKQWQVPNLGTSYNFNDVTTSIRFGNYYSGACHY